MKTKNLLIKKMFLIGLVLNGSILTFAQSNNLKSVIISSQTWMQENLNVEKFKNGDPIPQAKTDDEWLKADQNKKPAWCYYNNDPSNGKIYGKLYNWYAVNDPRGLAPEGWHIPSLDEWKTLVYKLGGKGYYSENAMKSTSGWQNNGENTSLLNIQPGGIRAVHFTNYGDIEFAYLGKGVYYWTSTVGADDGHIRSETACYLSIREYPGNGLQYSEILKSYPYTLSGMAKGNGFYVRCIKN